MILVNHHEIHTNTLHSQEKEKALEAKHPAKNSRLINFALKGA